MNRNYEEFVERLDIERAGNYIEYVPCIEADIAAVGDDVDNNELLIYLIMKNYTKGDRTILYDNMLHDEVIWNKHINSNSIVEIYEELDKYYIDSNNIRHSILNHVYSFKIRLLFDDGG